MNYRKLRYLTSSSNGLELPEDKGIEISFVGYSNVGKSSVINALSGIKNLARVSKTPGRTRLINFFYLDESRRLVDLPGYGYAKIAASTKSNWMTMIDNYFFNRKSLKGVILLVDSRRLIKKHDEILINLVKKTKKKIHILLTKSDKLSNNQNFRTRNNLKKWLEELQIDYEITFQFFSSYNLLGLQDLHEKINEWYEFLPEK